MSKVSMLILKQLYKTSLNLWRIEHQIEIGCRVMLQGPMLVKISNHKNQTINQLIEISVQQLKLSNKKSLKFKNTIILITQRGEEARNLMSVQLPITILIKNLSQKENRIIKRVNHRNQSLRKLQREDRKELKKDKIKEKRKKQRKLFKQQRPHNF